jgi:hypothetical protein
MERLAAKEGVSRSEMFRMLLEQAMRAVPVSVEQGACIIAGLRRTTWPWREVLGERSCLGRAGTIVLS